MVVIPPVAAEATELAEQAPGMLDDLLRNPWVQDLDHRYQVIQRIQEEINKRVADGNLWAGVFGGVLDAGRIIASGVFSVLTVLVLTLYFLASLPVGQAGGLRRRPGQPAPPVRSRSPRRSCAGSGPTPSGRWPSRRSTPSAPGS